MRWAIRSKHLVMSVGVYSLKWEQVNLALGVTLLMWNNLSHVGLTNHPLLFWFPQKNLRRAKHPNQQRRRRQGERHEIESTWQTSVCKELHILFMQHHLWQGLWTRVFKMNIPWTHVWKMKTIFIHVGCQSVDHWKLNLDAVQSNVMRC